MGIVVNVDSLSEFLWIKHVIDYGVMNCEKDYMKALKEKWIDINKTVTYHKTDIYKEDIELENN